jgi:hypothetical protein
MTMDKDIKEKLVRALRSGKYPQGRGTVYADGEYCVMGVLGRVCGEPLSYLKNSMIYCGRDGELLTAGETATFVDLNDRQRKSFAEIADYIEANL